VDDPRCTSPAIRTGEGGALAARGTILESKICSCPPRPLRPKSDCTRLKCIFVCNRLSNSPTPPAFLQSKGCGRGNASLVFGAGAARVRVLQGEFFAGTSRRTRGLLDAEGSDMCGSVSSRAGVQSGEWGDQAGHCEGAAGGGRGVGDPVGRAEAPERGRSRGRRETRRDRLGLWAFFRLTPLPGACLAAGA